jgi:Rieske Fe-S protein
VTQEPQTDSLATRRGVLAGVGLVGLAGVVTGPAPKPLAAEPFKVSGGSIFLE